MNSGGGFNPSSSMFTIASATITIASAVITIQNASGMGGGAGGGTGGGFGAGTGPIANAGLPPMVPNPAVPSPNAPPGGWNGYFSNLTRGGFNPNQMAQQAITGLPEGFGAGVRAAGLGALVYGEALWGENAWLASRRPGYQLGSDIIAQETAGMGYNRLLTPQRERIADLQGDLAWREALSGWTRYVPGLNTMYENRQRGYNREIEKQQAELIAQQGDIMAGLYGDPDRIRSVASARGAQGSLVRAFAGYGTNVSSAIANDPGLDAMIHMGYSVADVIQMSQDVAGYAGQTGNRDIRDAFRFGNTAQARQLTIDRAAATGDFSTLGHQVLSPELRRQYADRAFNRQNLIDTGAFGEVGVRQAQADVVALQQTGAGYRTLQSGYAGVNVGIDQQIASERGLSNIPGISDLERQQHLANIASLENQRRGNVIAGQQAEMTQRQTMIAADTSMSQLNIQRGLYSGAAGRDSGAQYASESSNMRREAARLREDAAREVNDPSRRRALLVQAEEKEFQASVGVARESSSRIFGEDIAGAGILSARAGAAMTQATLFGGAPEYGAAVGMQADPVRAQLQAIADKIARGNLSLEEVRNLTAQQITLQNQLVVIGQEQIRGADRMALAVGQTQLGISQTEYQTSVMRGGGGVSGARLYTGQIGQARGNVAKAQQLVNDIEQSMIQTKGFVDQNSPELNAARGALASEQQKEVGTELGTANVPFSLGLQRSLSASQYAAQVLTSVPGAYGNVRGALQNTVRGLEREAEELKAQHEIAMQNVSPENREAVDFQFQQRLQNIGIQQASAMQTLSYGWENRLISQTLGTPGNFGSIESRFSLRDAVGRGGVLNPHFGSTGENRPFFARQADEVLSIAGTFGQPESFGLSAITGTTGRGRTGIAGMPGFSGYGATPQGMSGIDRVVVVQLKWPNGSDAGTFSINTNKTNALSSWEDLASQITQQANMN
jgi:hypothetical protein